MNVSINDLPSSKSIVLRYLIAGAYTRHELVINNYSACNDTQVLINALSQCGYLVREAPRKLTIVYKHDVHSPIISCGDCGTAARLLPPFLIHMKTGGEVTASEQMKKRPMKELYDAFSSSACIQCHSSGALPWKITPPFSRQNFFTVDPSRSSQFVSSIMFFLAASGKGGEIKLLHPAVSKPYIKLTAKVLEEFQVESLLTEDTISISPSPLVSPGTITAETDWGAATFCILASILRKLPVHIPHLNPYSLQADAQIVGILPKFGITVKQESEGISFYPPKNFQGGFSIDLNHCPDTVPALAVLAAHTNGPVQFTGISHLRYKESDRISAIEHNLNCLNINVMSKQDSLTVYPGTIEPLRPLHHFEDHRIAMAFASIPGMSHSIDLKPAHKSFPGFLKFLQTL